MVRWFHFLWFRLLLVLLLLLLIAPAILGSVYVNIGMRDLHKIILEENGKPNNYPNYVTGETTAIASLQKATEINDSLTGRWALGRAALASTQIEIADHALAGIVGAAENNPLLWLDTVTTFSRSGRYDSVAALFASPPVEPPKLVGDTVALAYLNLATESTSEEESLHSLRQSVVVRPYDLYANYRLWIHANHQGDTDAEELFGERLKYYPIGAIAPELDALVDYTTSIIPSLYDNGLWDYERTVNAVSFWVWRYYNLPSVESLLEQLIVSYPSSTDWPFLLAELYHRRGDFAQAETIYKRLLTLSDGNIPTHFRLGMIAESQGRMAEAIDWYRQYLMLAPDDSSGLARLIGLCEVMECEDKTQLSERFETLYDAQKVVTYLSGLPAAQLGENLLENGNFGSWFGDQADSWQVGLYSGADHDSALYFAGKDTLFSAEGMARIITLWAGRSAEDAMTTYAEYIGDEFSAGADRYLVSVTYYLRTSPQKGAGILYLAGDPVDETGIARIRLPGTDGQIQTQHFLVDAFRGATWMKPTVRIWGEGELGIAKLEIQPLLSKSGYDEQN